MSLKDIKSHVQGGRMDLDNLPSEFNAKVTRAEWKTEKVQDKDKDFLYIDLTGEDGNVMTQKYSTMHMADLEKAMRDLGIDDIGLTPHLIHWKLKNYRMGFPRYMPTAIIK